MSPSTCTSTQTAISLLQETRAGLETSPNWVGDKPSAGCEACAHELRVSRCEPWMLCDRISKKGLVAASTSEGWSQRQTRSVLQLQRQSQYMSAMMT